MMITNVFKKIIRVPLRFYQNFKRNPNKFFWVTLPILLYEIWVVILIGSYFADEKKNTLGITSAAFAICISISSICFSWVKTLDAEKEIKDISIIKTTGEISLTIGIMFILATALKYGATVIPTNKNRSIFFTILFYALKSTYLFLFAITFFLTGKIMGNLLSLLYDRNRFDDYWSK
ncbi:MAG: hypothetical protein ACTHJ0_06880 [Flavipsychrobacter sp.]